MNGEISGRYGFLKYLKSEDNPKSPDEFIKINNENYEKAKSAEISRLSGIIYQFKNSPAGASVPLVNTMQINI